MFLPWLLLRLLLQLSLCVIFFFPLPPRAALVSLLEAWRCSLRVKVHRSMSPQRCNHSWKWAKLFVIAGVFTSQCSTYVELHRKSRIWPVASTHTTWNSVRAAHPAGLGGTVISPARFKGLAWFLLAIPVPELQGEIKFMNFLLHHGRKLPLRAVTHAGKPL